MEGRQNKLEAVSLEALEWAHQKRKEDILVILIKQAITGSFGSFWKAGYKVNLAEKPELRLKAQTLHLINGKH